MLFSHKPRLWKKYPSARRVAHTRPALNSNFEMVIFLFLKIIATKVQNAAIKNLIALKMFGGIDFKDSSTISNVIPQMNVVNTKPKIAR